MPWLLPLWTCSVRKDIYGAKRSAIQWYDGKTYVCDLTTALNVWVYALLECMYIVSVALNILLSYLLWQAAELLGHPHLEPYVLKVHLKINSPRRNSLPVYLPEPTYMKKTRFLEPRDVPLSTYRERRRLSSNDRTLNPSISGAEQDSLCSTQEILDNPRYLSRRLQERYSGGIHEETAISKTIVAKGSNIAKSSRRTPTKASSPPKRCESVRSVGISLSHSLYTHMHLVILEVWIMVDIIQLNKHKLEYHFSVGGFCIAQLLEVFERQFCLSLSSWILFVQFPASRTSRKSATAVRRASLPFSTRGARQQSPSSPNIGILHRLKSPDVSVNSPRIDRIAEFPLASYEEPVFSIRKTSTTSVQGSSGSPQYNDHSITKDKCTVQTDRASAKPSIPETWQGIRRSMFKADVKEGSADCSDQNATAGASSRSSSDSYHRRFDPSSFQQRAEALEGMLEFSARLLQQERYEELGVLLKPFGPGKVSSRETAIWLTKSFKENTLKQED